jgi:hypothetical protein
MIYPKFTEPLYDALCQVLNAIDDAGVLGVGGQPLQDAYKEADELLDEIDDYYVPMTPEAALSAALNFISGCQSEDADILRFEIQSTLNAMS